MTDAPTADPLPTALATALAAAEAARAGGDLTAGLEAAERAWALAAEPPQRLQAGRLLMHFRYRSGALWALVDAGLEVLPLMRAAAVEAGELIDTLRMVALGAADVGRFEEAMAAGQEALQRAQAADDGPRQSLSVNAVACVYERMGDPWHAERLLLDALALAREAGDRHATFVALNNLTATLVGAYYLLQDEAPADEVSATLERALPHAGAAVEMAEALDDPFYLAFVRGNRGEVLAHLGQLEAAQHDLDAAMAMSRSHGFEAQSWRVAVSLGELHLRRGDAGAAWSVLDAALHDAAGAQARNTRLRLHHALWRAARALGRTDAALEHLEQYQRLEHARLLSQLRGRSQLFVTTLEAERVRLEAHRAGERAVRAEVVARIDALTGLGNRRELQHRFAPLAQRLQATGAPLAVAMIDLDHFKQVNDRFGHAAGDAVLVALARLLRENTRGDDLAIRLGGEEFLLVLPEAGAERLREVCERLRRLIAGHDWSEVAPGLQVALSVGIAAAPPYDLQSLLARADAALYAAKRSGRDRVHVG